MNEQGASFQFSSKQVSQIESVLQPQQQQQQPKAQALYEKLLPNIYTFTNDKDVLQEEHNIYIQYHNACEKRKQGHANEALKMFEKCLEMITRETNILTQYEIYVNLALLDVSKCAIYYPKAIELCGERAEPYYYWAIQCNRINDYEKAFELLTVASSLSYENAVNKYGSSQETAYGSYLQPEIDISKRGMMLNRLSINIDEV